MNELKRMNWNEWIDMNDSSTSWPTSSSKSGPKLSVVLRFLCEIGLSLQSRDVSCTFCIFCRTHLQKVPPPKKKKTSVFDDFFVINYLMTTWSTDEMKLSLQSRAHFVDLMVDLILKKWSEATLPEKNTGCCAWESFQQWIHAFPIAHTSQLLDDDNDVIDMMMWLTWWLRWWCGCHDGETASHWQSSVTRKFPN